MRSTRGDTVTRGQGDKGKLLSDEGAGGGLAPELINIDHVFANSGDGDF